VIVLVIVSSVDTNEVLVTVH